MERQKLSPRLIAKLIIRIIRDIIFLFVLLICILSPLGFFLAYFILKNSVNASVDFFLHWTCASILTVTIGFSLKFLSALMDASNRPTKTKKRIPVLLYIPIILAGIISQSLIMTYLFATYQPGPDQMSRIHMLSWILFTIIIHALWVWGYNFKKTLYVAIGRSMGIDSAHLSKLIMPLSALGAIILWITIAALMVRQ